jgi:hypothetical protein
MAAPGDYLDLDDLKDVTAGGLVREEVLDQIFDISDIPTVFLDMIGTEGMDNGYTEWTEDKLAAPDITNKRISGSDLVSTDNKATVANAKRVGNHAQLSDKPVFVTDRSEDVRVIGRSSEMGYQTSQRMIELRRDVEQSVALVKGPLWITAITLQVRVQDSQRGLQPIRILVSVVRQRGSTLVRSL